MKEIQLTRGMVAMVDDEDFERINAIKWTLQKGGNTFYAVNSRNNNTLMHRVILKAKKGEVTDHINHNGLDNRKINLRLCTHSENLRHRKKHKNNDSGYKGVYADKKTKTPRYRAQIRVNKKKICIGSFGDPVDAAKAYDKAAKKYHGEFALTNF